MIKSLWGGGGEDPRIPTPKPDREGERTEKKYSS